MKKIVLVLLMALFFIGCTQSSLKLNKKEELLFNYNSAEFLLANKIEKHNLLNYKDMFVKQYDLVNEEGRVLFYEEAKTNMDFEFNYGGLYTVMHIFSHAQKYEEVYRENNLRLVQLQLKDSTYVNVLIQSSDTQYITYAYGFSNHEFIKLAKQLNSDENREIKQLTYQGLTLTVSQSPVTNWNDKMVYFTPLITPLRIMGGR